MKLLLPLLLSLPLAAAAAPSAVVTTPQVRAELVAQAPEGIAAGKPLALGLAIEHQPHWHTYWKNPGDSGLPTTLRWTLPPGFSAGEIAWPTPQKLPIGPLLNYGYEGRLLLPVAVTVPAGYTGDTLPVRLHADWLVCKDVCIPQSGEFAFDVPVRAATAAHAALFDAARAALPQPVAGADAGAKVDGDALVVRVAGLPPAWRGKALALLPELPGVLQNAAAAQGSWQGDAWTARLPLDTQRSESPARLPVVLTAAGPPAVSSDAGRPAGVAVVIDVRSPWPAVAQTAPLPALGDAVVTAPAAAAAAAPRGLLATLAVALVGGLLLNLMPCVFPVLSLKVLGFTAHAHDRRRLLGGGIAYAVGVVSSFVALAGLLLALRAGGEQLGWGFQLQSPPVVAAMAALFTLLGLSLAGVFDFGMVVPSRVCTAQMRHPLADSLLTGVLAVGISSPCTAPFMGASLGAAATLPPAQALAIFAVLGLGMALPFLLLSAWPGLARVLPRPGAWMAHVKVLMAFPMFATVVWLVWVIGQQAGIDAAAALLAALVALAFVAWAFGSNDLGPRARRGFGAAALAALAATLFFALPDLRETSIAPVSASAGWEPWSADRVAAAKAAGRPVFVDFTAAWCVTCQVNKRTTLERADVEADFERRNVVRLRADWTRHDAAIGAELQKLNRSGVPVYALYAPGSSTPTVLSEILTVRDVRDALAALPVVTARNP